MISSFFQAKKNILFLTDDHLCIYMPAPSGVQLMKTVEWSDPDFQSTVYNVLKKFGKGRPIIILNDMLEQHYRKERIIRGGVGAFDRANLIRRKLAAAFPNYPMRAYLPLKEKAQKSKTGAAADTYVFAAIPNSGAFTQTVDATTRSDLKLTGTYLLPIESADMVQLLTAKLLKKKQAKQSWTIFIGHHKYGGLRQIVTKGGELALTRMTPISDMELDPDQWIDDVSQEFKATMSYVARFGYEPTDGLNVIVISDDAAGEKLEETIGAEADFHSVSLSQASKLLGLKIDSDLSGDYADILHAAWASGKSALKLPLRVHEIDRYSRPRQVITLLSLLLLASGSYFAYEGLNGFSGLQSLRSDISKAAIRKSRLEQEYNEELAKKEQQGINFALVQNGLRVHDKLEKNTLDALGLFDGIGKALEGNLKVDEITIEQKEPNKVEDFISSIADLNIPFVAIPDHLVGDVTYEVSLQIVYPTTTNVDNGNRQIQKFSDRLRKQFPDHQVEVTKFLKDFRYTDQIVIDSTESSNSERAKQDFIAQIVIRGVRV